MIKKTTPVKNTPVKKGAKLASKPSKKAAPKKSYEEDDDDLDLDEDLDVDYDKDLDFDEDDDDEEDDDY